MAALEAIAPWHGEGPHRGPTEIRRVVEERQRGERVARQGVALAKEDQRAAPLGDVGVLLEPLDLGAEEREDLGEAAFGEEQLAEGDRQREVFGGALKVIAPGSID